MVAKKPENKTFKDSDENLDKALQNLNTKMIIDFDCKILVSMNSFAANKKDNFKVTTKYCIRLTE